MDVVLAHLPRPSVGYDERDSIVVLLKVARMFAPLRGDPRFEDLARRVGLP